MTGYNTYVGARYVPIFDGEWNNTKTYEPLIIVSHNGNSYTSKTFVPVGVDITNETYWALTGNYNAQVEYYRKETAEVKSEFLKSIRCYDTNEELIADESITSGQCVKVLGDTNINDGGTKILKIVDTIPNSKYVKLNNGLYGKIINEKFISKNAGWKDNGVTLGVVANEKPGYELPICGFSSVKQMTTDYLNRDGVSLYSGIANNVPQKIDGNTVFNINSVTVPTGTDISNICDGNYIDVYDSNGNRYTSIVDHISGNTIYTKYDGFYKIGETTPSAPDNGSTIYINMLTALWAINANTVIYDDRDSKVQSARICEFGMNNNKSDVYTEGVLITQLGTVHNGIGLDVSGAWDASILAKNGNIGFLTRDSSEDRSNMPNVLEHQFLRDDDWVYLGSIDKNFNIRNGLDAIKIGNRVHNLAINGANVTGETNGELSLGTKDTRFNQLFLENGIVDRQNILQNPAVLTSKLTKSRYVTGGNLYSHKQMAICAFEGDIYISETVPSDTVIMSGAPAPYITAENPTICLIIGNTSYKIKVNANGELVSTSEIPIGTGSFTGCYMTLNETVS